MILSFNDYLNESVNDKLKLKVLFLCGAPNSGKSTFIKKLSYIPFVNIDMDNYVKLFADKEGVDLDMRTDASDFAKKTNIRIKSRDLAVDRMENAINSLLAIVIDGTGKDADSILKQKEIYEAWGYDTALVFIDVDLDLALARNKERERKVPEQIIMDIHGRLSRNIELFKKKFRNFWVYNSTTDTGYDFKKVEKGVRNFFYSPIQNPKGKEILAELKKRKLKYLSDIDDNVSDIDLFQ